MMFWRYWAFAGITHICTRFLQAKPLHFKWHSHSDPKTYKCETLGPNRARWRGSRSIETFKIGQTVTQQIYSDFDIHLQTNRLIFFKSFNWFWTSWHSSIWTQSFQFVALRVAAWGCRDCQKLDVQSLLYKTPHSTLVVVLRPRLL